MNGLRAILTPRDVRSQLHASCSDVSLNGDILYATQRPVSNTEVQRTIESVMQLPSSAWLISVGGLELCFSDGVRLSSIGLYANFSAAPPEDLAPSPHAPPVWLALPGFDLAEDDRFSVDAKLRISVDRRRGAVRLRMGGAGHDHQAYSLADGLEARVDAAGCLTDLLAHGIEWIASTPV